VYVSEGLDGCDRARLGLGLGAGWGSGKDVDENGGQRGAKGRTHEEDFAVAEDSDAGVEAGSVALYRCKEGIDEWIDGKGGRENVRWSCFWLFCLGSIGLHLWRFLGPRQQLQYTSNEEPYGTDDVSESRALEGLAAFLLSSLAVS